MRMLLFAGVRALLWRLGVTIVGDLQHREVVYHRIMSKRTVAQTTGLEGEVT